MITRFISDLHLSENRPDITGLFVSFLRGEARESDALYILGDLFDYWIGDDDLRPFHLHIIQELKNVVESGVPVYFMAGNRDFLIGKKFAELTGITILPDPTVVDLYGTPTLLLHGDTLCTQDEGYQKFRKTIRNPLLLGILTKLPLSWRRKVAQKLRANSKSQQNLSAEQLAMMDATEEAVVQAFESHKVERMIHGHTHQPDIHEHPLSEGKTGLRIVLGDWYEQGSILELTADTFILRNEPFSEDED
ncbi:MULTISPECIES: UDP-2,3-diacylglucosamine diphosphatase [Gammaproteobacteria]|uniref:UDP-2,3-diacylglucosamine diphosphatase n=1 Tax=Gammaproteobacteria TaxID=1236 RepID=UPI000DD0AB5F|nr:MULTISPECIES: UDP-2,3-diacylglucosamine diphosphatase [Gammaproteobacteria]RTE86847.1 UDP-2,3-diacylglucosamine diphosphatase [Aliidiomarina sp. B3213]TCZ93364.1 UDP-2,3-diacylglucosamine diphosphatase [Lysobacter sp. N42]